MMMAAAWNGVACCPVNSLTVTGTEVVLAVWRVRTTTDETPGVLKVVTLAAGTRGVRLWTPDDTLSVALDTPPQPEGASNDSLIEPTDFTRGSTVMPGQWALFLIPQDTFAHTCQFFSSGSFSQVKLEFLIASA
jgi:hypothetical protein